MKHTRNPLSSARRTLLVTLAGASLSQGASIILVTQDAVRDTDLINHLGSLGHTVTTGVFNSLDATPGDVTTLNQADLILVSRNTNSGDYASNATEVAAWDGLGVPLVLGNAFISRNNRWSYVDTAATQDNYGLDMAQLVVSPLFNGLTPNEDFLTDPGATPAYSGLDKFRLSTSTDIAGGSVIMGDGIVLGTRNNPAIANIMLATWDAGQMTGSGNVLGGDRTFFAMPEDFSSYNANGIQLLDNIVGAALVPEPSTSLLGLASLAGGLLFRRRK